MEHVFYVVCDDIGWFITQSGQSNDTLANAHHLKTKDGAEKVLEFWENHENKTRETMREKGRKDESTQPVKYTVWKVTATVSLVEEGEE